MCITGQQRCQPDFELYQSPGFDTQPVQWIVGETMTLQPHCSRRASLGLRLSDQVLFGSDQNQNGRYPQQISPVKPEQSVVEAQAAGIGKELWSSLHS